MQTDWFWNDGFIWWMIKWVIYQSLNKWQGIFERIFSKYIIVCNISIASIKMRLKDNVIIGTSGTVSKINLNSNTKVVTNLVSGYYDWTVSNIIDADIFE